jgi:2'-5' RNA ligase
MASFSSPHFQLTSNETAVALVVPAHLQPEINSLRRLHDKAYRRWNPHINILYPFVEPSRLASAVTILRDCLQSHQTKKIAVNIYDVGIFKHRKNATVFLKPSVESEESIRRLRNIMVHALGCDERAGTHDGIFRPHITVGQAGLHGSSIEKLTEEVKKLAGIEWVGTTLAVLRREVSGEMRMVGEIALDETVEENQKGEMMRSNRL